MERLSLRKALLKFYEDGKAFTIPDVLSNNPLLKTLNCGTPLNRSRVRDEVTAIIREGIVPGKIDKTNGEAIYQLYRRRRGEMYTPQYSKTMKLALGLN